MLLFSSTLETVVNFVFILFCSKPKVLFTRQNTEPSVMMNFDLNGDVISWMLPQQRGWARSLSWQGSLHWHWQQAQDTTDDPVPAATGVTEVVNCALIEMTNCFTHSRSGEAVHHQVADTTAWISNAGETKWQRWFRKTLSVAHVF